MGTLKKDFKYKIIKNFLNESELILLNNYTLIKHITNNKNFDIAQSNIGDTFGYSDPLMESLLLKKNNLMETETNLKLFPTYSFWRMYTHGAVLDKHKDRPSCEVSVTISISSCGTEWPIYVEDKPIFLKPGEALIYLGMELSHYRKKFEGDYAAQVFLHYVDQNDKHKEFEKDKRFMYGLPKIL